MFLSFSSRCLSVNLVDHKHYPSEQTFEYSFSYTVIQPQLGSFPGEIKNSERIALCIILMDIRNYSIPSATSLEYLPRFTINLRQM